QRLEWRENKGLAGEVCLPSPAHKLCAGLWSPDYCNSIIRYRGHFVFGQVSPDYPEDKERRKNEYSQV
ncbi:MAG: hypothetical protein AAB019_07485, partial [Planctomycetota bacterium]